MLQRIAADRGRLVYCQDDSLATIVGDVIKLATVEGVLARLVMRAMDLQAPREPV